jgi:hypothetical protein
MRTILQHALPHLFPPTRPGRLKDSIRHSQPSKSHSPNFGFSGNVLWVNSSARFHPIFHKAPEELFISTTPSTSPSLPTGSFATAEYTALQCWHVSGAVPHSQVGDPAAQASSRGFFFFGGCRSEKTCSRARDRNSNLPFCHIQSQWFIIKL